MNKLYEQKITFYHEEIINFFSQLPAENRKVIFGQEDFYGTKSLTIGIRANWDEEAEILSYSWFELTHPRRDKRPITPKSKEFSIVEPIVKHILEEFKGHIEHEFYKKIKSEFSTPVLIQVVKNPILSNVFKKQLDQYFSMYICKPGTPQSFYSIKISTEGKEFPIEYTLNKDQVESVWKKVLSGWKHAG